MKNKLIYLCAFMLGANFALINDLRSEETTVTTETTKPTPEAGTTVDTTTIEKTDTQAPKTTSHRPAAHRSRSTTTPRTKTSITTTQTTVETRPRAVYSPKAIKKMASAGALCAQGFKAYVGNDKKNVCQVNAEPPDLAYTCVWKEKGPASFAATSAGPCTIDYAEYKEKLPMDRSHYKSSPPFAYGTDVHCCFRAAEGTEVTHKQVHVGH
jgi:hypothetical protein